MRITGLTVYSVILHALDGRYSWGRGRHVDDYDATIVRIDTDEGITGYGEVCCPNAPGYTPYFAGGVRAGIRELADSLLGQDPTCVSVINDIMDRNLTGHDYAKSGIDMACWDILGQKCGVPVTTLLGGRFGENFGLYHPVGQDTPEAMTTRVDGYRSAGYTAFQLKVGGEPLEDIARIRAVAAGLTAGEKLIADANRGWLPHEALQVLDAIADLPVFIEQPCASYRECLSVRRRCSKPFILDESIQSAADILRAAADDAADIINLKIAKLGGITKTARARDLCVSLGIPVFIDNAKGSQIVGAALAHLAHSTPQEFLFATTDFGSYMEEQIAAGCPVRKDGRLASSVAPGLGIKPDLALLGDSVFEQTL